MPSEADNIMVTSPDINQENIINNECGPCKAVARKTQAYKTRIDYIEENELLRSEIELLKQQLSELTIRVNTGTSLIMESPVHH